MLERNFGDNTAYTLTVDEMAGVYDMLEESHFPISVTFTFLAEWFESVRCFDTAEKIRELLDTYEPLALKDEPAPNKEKGHWVKCQVRGQETICCSKCGGDTGTIYEYDFCPHCGIEMDGDSDDES